MDALAARAAGKVRRAKGIQRGDERGDAGTSARLGHVLDFVASAHGRFRAVVVLADPTEASALRAIHTALVSPYADLSTAMLPRLLVFDEADPDVVVVGGLRFHAMCPHHLLPYRGIAHVAYLPAGKLVGFGRLAELVDCFTKRLTLQERATHQIADALCRHLGARGAGCVIEAEQLCLALPGERHDQSGVVTSAFVGEMRERPDLKARLLAAAQLGGGGR